MLTRIIKRDGREVAFDRSKITDAIFKAAQVLGGSDYQMAQDLAAQVEAYVERILGEGAVPTVEQVQDAVEHTLIENGHARTAKEYILYRAERTRVREMNTRLMKTLEDLTFKDAEDATPSGRTPTSTATPPWAPCSSTARRAPSSSTRCMSSTPGTPRPTWTAISTSTTWTSSR